MDGWYALLSFSSVSPFLLHIFPCHPDSLGHCEWSNRELIDSWLKYSMFSTLEINCFIQCFWGRGSGGREAYYNTGNLADLHHPSCCVFRAGLTPIVYIFGAYSIVNTNQACGHIMDISQVPLANAWSLSKVPGNSCKTLIVISIYSSIDLSHLFDWQHDIYSNLEKKI